MAESPEVGNRLLHNHEKRFQIRLKSCKIKKQLVLDIKKEYLEEKP